jgi:hypothetical protein
VLDPTTNTIHLVTKTKTSSTNYIQRLHALNLLTGAEQTNSPVVIFGVGGRKLRGRNDNSIQSADGESASRTRAVERDGVRGVGIARGQRHVSRLGVGLSGGELSSGSGYFQ